MGKVLIVYATKTGNTREIAEFVAEGVRFTGNQAVVREVTEIEFPGDLETCDALIIGSPTYSIQMMEEIKTLLDAAADLNLAGKKGGAFGAYGWSGEAPGLIYNFMKDHYCPVKYPFNRNVF